MPDYIKKLMAAAQAGDERAIKSLEDLSVAALYQFITPPAKMPTVDELVQRRLEFVERIGEVARHGTPLEFSERAGVEARGKAITEPGAWAGHHDTVARPLLMGLMYRDLAGFVGKEKAFELVEQAFIRGFDRRRAKLSDWLPALTEEQRHFLKLLTTVPTPLDDGGVRKARYRAERWLAEHGELDAAGYRAIEQLAEHAGYIIKDRGAAARVLALRSRRRRQR